MGHIVLHSDNEVPPHTRGTLSYSSLITGISGINPAYAGNTKSFDKHFCKRRDHPRMRGTPSFPLFHIHIAGITPAYAGNTASVQLSLSNTQDHPRLRGEHDCIRYRNIGLPGSPPLTRGTPVRNFKCSYLDRITPAYAGNT